MKDKATKSNKLKINPIKLGAAKTLAYIQDRASGKVTSLKTSKSKFNKALLNGLDWGRILSIAGLPSAGKSTILEEMKRDFLNLNENNFDILSFEFEMLIEDQLTRRLASELGKPVKDIYSADKPFEDLDKVESILNKISEEPIYYVDEIGSVDEVEDTIMSFVVNKSMMNNRGLVVTIDHVLLTKGEQGDVEKSIVDNLMRRLVAIKKKVTAMNVKISFIVLSQLNRDIQHSDRVLNPNLHFPTKNDIFGSSSVYQCSDYVLITHRPATIEGIKAYGPRTPQFPKGLPLKHEGRDVIYWHLIKERFGALKILAMLEDFKNSRVEEISMSDLN